ncbi:cholesterol transporter ABCA5 isoform X1 [Poecilia reticulata]|uniref:Cholesterol transporter ABCA5 n=1 Tax=Poecilia reticulata TaxID=8081 RepID=A0A3P9PLP1_POERE|nr:PREDICTED: ATP-binding cassette sub-family A member 5-like isoform X1 [Poecilia reticulata]XP_008435869.1 PREDICTED: ATP-binding cassette sub-family A member 5-like isoform X1 [Poecilia reticulata]
MTISSAAEASLSDTSRPHVIHMRNAGSMQPVFRRDAGVWPQTQSLLYKNLLIKWRTKQQSLQELILPLLLLGLLILISTLNPHVYYGAINTAELPNDDFFQILKSLAFTPNTNITSRIMDEVANVIGLQDPLEMFSSEKELENASLNESSSFIGVVFLDSSATSYRLRFPHNKLPLPSDYTESIASCYSSMLKCKAANYWYSGFTRLQSVIDAAIIEVQTRRSVRKELDIKVVMMGQPGSVEVHKFPHALISIYLVLAFTPFVTFLIVNVAAEKEHRLKDTMTMMGLYDTAFWLSWGLLYAALVTAMSILMAIIATYTALFPNSDFFVVFSLIFLYGISSIFFSFMLTPLFKKPKFASTVGSMLTVVFGCMSLFTVLMRDFPQPLVWLLCLLSPSAFSIGIAQVVYLEAQGDGAVFSSLTNGPHPLYVPLVMLALDCILYLLLTLYLDQVLPGDFGIKRSMLYFLKPSYWSKHRKRYVEVSSVYDAEANGAPGGDECVEPVSPEFRGKEAIRITNICKVYKDKDSTVDALRGFTFDIYEGQITALLGHSGAGKSTLMNILCGICPPTNGSATIYGSPVAEIAEGSEMKQLVGICPQFNIIFDVLTVEEHLRIFAAIKGIPPADVDAEVTRVLKDLDLEKIMTAQAKNLSGGQKRKLSVGIAILGDPKILLLDEPTAGMDPCSRHQVWSLLKSRRAGRVIVLSTHYMDEADILADRKAVISQGQLKCVGSSLYLKIKCGVGYHLRMSISEGCDMEKVTSLMKQHVPKAKLSRQHDTELTFTLPFESMNTFSGLFSELDCQPQLGIINYGVSMTTLEDVFLRLESEAEVDQADYSVFNREQAEDEGDIGSLDDTDQQLLTFSDSKSDSVTGHALWRQQFSAVAWLHMLNMRREWKAFVYTLVLFLLFLSSVLIVSLVTGNIQIHSQERQFLPTYLLKKNEAPHRYATSLLVKNSTNSDISDLIRNLESQDIKVELMKQNDYMDAAPHSAAINVTRSKEGFRYTIAFNSTTIHSLPMAVNILSNALLRGLNGTGRIRTWTKPFDYQIPDATSYALVYIEAIMLGMLAVGMPAYFAMDHTRDREIKCRSTLRISGLLPSAYWCGQAAVDIPFYYLILSSMNLILFCFHSGNLSTNGNLTAVVLCTVGFGPAMIVFTYVVSFGFTRVQSNRDFFSFICMMVCVVSASIVQLSFVNDNLELTRTLHNILCFFNPLYPLMGCLNCITKATFLPVLYEENFLWKSLLISVVAPYLQCILLLFLLRWLEIRYGGRAMKNDQLCRISSKPKAKPERIPEEGQNEDEDVQMEKARVKEALTCQACEEKPVVVVNNLRKQYKGRKEGFSFTKRTKVATKNVSFCVRKGEVLGLLGPNGSGKSTVMHMLSGDTNPTAGQILMGDYSTEFRPVENPLEHVGYCPQVNPLWPRITLQEHLELYAAIKGLKGQEVPGIIKRVSNALELREHLNKQAKNLSAGLKRKLCFALSMIGNPQIVLLDEPSSGMDPKSKQRMWRAMRVAFRNHQRGAILTTHYMEEAEAVCDRVAIMVSGQLRCIGSIQHLKAKYGQGYSLELKLREELTGLQQVALLHKEILRIFPHALRQESFTTLMVYKIPMEDVKSLAHSFSKLENAKQTFNFEEYNFSQSTLEQVFLEFAKEQENDEDEVGPLSTTFQWQRLQQDAAVSANHVDSVVHQL